MKLLITFYPSVHIEDKQLPGILTQHWHGLGWGVKSIRGSVWYGEAFEFLNITADLHCHSSQPWNYQSVWVRLWRSTGGMQILFTSPCWEWTSRQNVFEQGSPIFLAPKTSAMEVNFSTDGSGGHSSGSDVRNGKPWQVADEAPLAYPPLTSCCEAQLHKQGSRTPDFEDCQIIRTHYTQQLRLAHICSLNVWISSNIWSTLQYFLFQLYWDIPDMYYCTSFMCTNWCLHPLLYYE